MPALAPLTAEITMELLTDVARATAKVAVDFVPAHATVSIHREPPCVVLRVPGETTPAIEAALHELGAALKATTDAAIPSLPLRYTVIGGSEAAGIEITVEPNAEPVYGHIITARLAWLQPSAWLRRLRPNLPERIDL